MSRPKSFGDENTHLVLTDKAFDAYSACDPLDILEYEDEDGNYTYALHGALERDNLTVDEVNKMLEHEWLEQHWDAIVSLMDDDIREAIHADLAPCTEEEFLAEYAKRHEQRYNPFVW